MAAPNRIVAPRRDNSSFIEGTGKADGRPELQDTAALDDAKQYHDDGNHQQDVNEPANGIAGHETEQPEDEQDEGDGIKHKTMRGR